MLVRVLKCKDFMMKNKNNIALKTSSRSICSFANQIQFKIAKTNSDLLTATNLVFNQYLESGYVYRQNSNLHFGLQDIYPDRRTIIASFDNTIFATATIIPDSFVGLPIDNLFEPELNKLRIKDHKLCEISMLACNNALLKDKKTQLSNFQQKFLIYYLFKYIFEYTKFDLNMDYICITINPSQNNTYKNLFFKDIGKIKSYYLLEGALAMGKILNLKTINTNLAKSKKSIIHQIVFSKIIRTSSRL